MNIFVNNVNLYYDVLGAGRPIILLNPNSVNTGIMRKLGNSLAKENLVYMLDRRGCGKSQRGCTMTYEESAEDVYQFILKLGLKDVTVLGLSGGASVGLFLSIMHPESVKKLILCSGVARNSIIKYSPFTNFIFSLPWYPGKKNVDMFLKLNSSAKDLTGVDLNKITAKTLVINGGIKDIVPIAEAEFISKNIENSELIILDKEGHGSYIGKKMFAEKIIDYLKKD